jgi:hypothetical protein
MWTKWMTKSDHLAQPRVEPRAARTGALPGDVHRIANPVAGHVAVLDFASLSTFDDNHGGSDTVFGILGTPVSTDQREWRGRPAGSAGESDLLSALHEQYCRVLDDPQWSPASGQWAQYAVPAHDFPASDQDESAGNKPDTDAPSIDELLSGARNLRDAFGLVDTGEVPATASVEPVPEILRLFAPAEYLAAQSRRSPPLPAALTRREHHSLGIDSPLPAAGTTLNREST